MGYTTTFKGQISIDPPLNDQERDYLARFAGTRRMHRKNGPYYLGKGLFGQDSEPDIIEYNTPPVGQPGLWCKWVPTHDGKALMWNGAEKFYKATHWMQYLIEHFLKPDAIAKQDEPERFAFLQGHTLNGVIHARGEDSGDLWTLRVVDNYVQREDGRNGKVTTFTDSQPLDMVDDPGDKAPLTWTTHRMTPTVLEQTPPSLQVTTEESPYPPFPKYPTMTHPPLYTPQPGSVEEMRSREVARMAAAFGKLSLEVIEGKHDEKIRGGRFRACLG